jgi:hypothetical protein
MRPRIGLAARAQNYWRGGFLTPRWLPGCWPWCRLEQSSGSSPSPGWACRGRNPAAPRACGQTLHRRLSQHDQRHRCAPSAVRRRQETLAIELIESYRDLNSRQRAIAGQIRRQDLAFAARQRPNASRCPKRSLKGSRRYGKIAWIASLARGSILSRAKAYYPAQAAGLKQILLGIAYDLR